MVIRSLFKKLDSIDREYVFTDKHIHSNWTDGEMDIVQIIDRAKKLQLSHIGITDHVRKNSSYFFDYHKEICKFSEAYGIKIYVGFESKIINFNGELDVSEEIRKLSDIKIASVHSYPIGKRLYEAKQFTKRTCQEIEFDLTIAAIKTGGCNVIGHTGGMSIKYYQEFPLEFFEEVIACCSVNDVAFELNYRYHIPYFESLLYLLKKYNSFVSFGSDAHTLSEIGNISEYLQGKINLGDRNEYFKTH